MPQQPVFEQPVIEQTQSAKGSKGSKDGKKEKIKRVCLVEENIQMTPEEIATYKQMQKERFEMAE